MAVQDSQLIPNTKIVHGQTTIVATNAAQTLGSSTRTKSLILKTKESNVSTMYIGTDSTLTASNGYPLNPGEPFSIEIDDINKIYIYGTQNDVVYYFGSV